jgi:carbonic anhydrase
MSDQRAWGQLIEAHRLAEAGPIEVAPEHAPKAAILACSDARVPPSVIFDQPAGSLFVVRIAGNTASAAALASLDYAVAKLGVEVLIVLGHTSCGAVQAAAAGTVEELIRHDGPVGVAARNGRLDVRGAVHNLLLGTLELVNLETTEQPATLEAS